MAAKAYLGDGCYIDYDGYALVLTTENGISETNRIVLEPEVYEALAAYVDSLKDTPDPDGEEFRGGEAAAYASEQQAVAQRLK